VLAPFLFSLPSTSTDSEPTTPVKKISFRPNSKNVQAKKISFRPNSTPQHPN
jgi:hypothetical protein